MSWVLPMPIGADDFFVHESAVNSIVADAPAIFMCLYDLQQFGAQMLVDVLHTLPQVLLDNRVIDNPHYVPPSEYIASRPPADRTLAAPRDYPLARVPQPSPCAATRDRWSALTGAETRVAELVASVCTKLDIHSRIELTVLTMQHA
jgi:hypothetical protein